ncbi:hypothetical protein [Flaviaesturariibacter aridisoli]|uniref:Uncharacterized protein n=1 Tax=Flaviaesturariibacter aridisoli TaxID=2545761 RepID=A0A4R4E3D0_9BACT|nr:hypothetical protein [Flaviaesturariibacter aridisoli]TCZ70517.1 hypothetical protein E0486_11210 [Flaviaesturariibacter aridisoli]
MHSAKPDKPFAATDLLTELPEGVSFRQAEVWAGLEGALERRKRRGLLIRWSAAAALLLALALGWWLRPIADVNKEVARKEPLHTAPAVAPASAPENAPVANAAARTVETRTIIQPQHKTIVAPAPNEDDDAPVLIAQAPAPIDTLEQATIASVNTTATTPARRRFRVGHINDNAPQEPVLIADVPADDRSNYGLIHIPLTGNAGPNAGTIETVERKPRTLMSLFKPHQ